jgi:hypothetical protein
VNGHPMRSHNGNYRTDGTHLWSYDLMIGKRDAEGKPILLNVMSLISPRTSDHVREAIEPQVKLVVPAVDPDNLSAYTRYSFPENPEEDTENLWGREKEPITFIPTRIRTEFPPDDYIEINDPVYFKKLKLPKDSMSAYISDVDTNEYHERLGLRNFCEFWISSDCWNYVAALEDRVLFMEYTEAKSTERIVYAYFLTRYTGSHVAYTVKVLIDGDDVDYYDETELRPRLPFYSGYSHMPEGSRFLQYRGGLRKGEWQEVVDCIWDATQVSKIRVVERDNTAYRRMREEK